MNFKPKVYVFYAAPTRALTFMFGDFLIKRLTFFSYQVEANDIFIGIFVVIFISNYYLFFCESLRKLQENTF